MVGKMARARGWNLGRILGAMTVSASACLPSADLDSYGQGEPIAIEDEAGENAAAPSASEPEPVPTAPETDSASNSEAGSGTSEPGSSEAETGSCTGDCPLLAPTPTTGEGAASVQSLDAGTDAASNTGSEPLPPVSDAGTPLPSCLAPALLGPEDRCFVLATQLQAWSDARSACQALGTGWDLATIRSAERNAWLIGLLGTVQDAWIGASDLDVEGVWRWVTDASAFWNGGPTGTSVGGAFTSWNGGATPEPNGAEASDCLRLRITTGWADFQCATTYASICEGPSL
jgi:Lectin C-type domain